VSLNAFFSIKVFTVIKLCYLTMLDKQGAMGLVKPTNRPDHDVDDHLYLILTIPQLFLKPLQVM